MSETVSTEFVDTLLEYAKKSIGVQIGSENAIRMCLEIKEARQRIAELEAAQRWVPVSERMPPIGLTVAILWVYDGCQNFFYPDVSEAEQGMDGEIFLITRDGKINKDVVYWTYLPDWKSLPSASDVKL